MDASGVTSIAVSPSGDVLVGFARTDVHGTPYTLAYLDGEDGEVLWLYDTGVDSSVDGVAFDGDGNCYATGDEGSDTYSVWAFESDGTPLWTDDGSLGDHTMAVIYGDYLYVDAGFWMIRLDLATGTEDEAFTALEMPPIMGFDYDGNVYGFVDGTGYLIYRIPASLSQSVDWLLLWEDDDPSSLAVAPHNRLYLVDEGDIWSGGSVYALDAATGEDAGGDWPVSRYGSTIIGATAVSVGLVGAFYDSWPVPPHIYVGNVLYE
jgi:hypothetical protein